MNDALTEAILWLQDEPEDSQLIGVSFLRYSDRTGFRWELKFRRTVANSEVQDSKQDNEQRISMIVAAWAEAMDKLRASAPDPRVVVPS
jgi:hypothetical protein